MKQKKILFASILVLFVLFQIQTAFAHSGRTDANGGHWDMKNGTYHYHNGGGSSSNSNSSTPKTVYPTSVKAVKPNGKMYLGNSVKLDYTVSPSNANDKSVKWSSSNENIAKDLQTEYSRLSELALLQLL